jgi:hypothetical protein
MGWHPNDLTLAASVGANGGEATGYVFDAQGTQHVFYTRDHDVHELWWDSNGWHHTNLTAATGAPPSATRPAGYVFPVQSTQHVFYLGFTDAHIHELWWDFNGWHHNDLTAATGAPLAGPSQPALLQVTTSQLTARSMWFTGARMATSMSSGGISMKDGITTT